MQEVLERRVKTDRFPQYLLSVTSFRLGIPERRYVTMRIPHLRKDILSWVAKVGYVETGDGSWEDQDGGAAQDLTRPTRYVTFTVCTLLQEVSLE